ncbi:MAG: hypothetical protein WCV81_05255 [Microgenomates group bacterium]|jgi:hypothetical protein
MSLNKSLLGLILALFIFPTIAHAEIATVKDWIGLFPINVTGYSKADTYAGCPSLDPINKYCWFYTSSPTCNQVAGTVPKLADNPATCSFTFNPLPPVGYYVFRLMANDEQTIDALIATSRQMYTNATASATLTPTPTPVAANGKLYRITGDLTLNSDITVYETGVIFVDGNLTINTNILNNNATKGLVFVVKGEIFIQRDVTKVNAFLIAHGKNSSGDDITPFCTAYDPVDGCNDYAVNATRKYLEINGSIISLNQNTAYPANFARKKYDAILADKPAETINYEAKYLVIMKDIFSRDLRIWREVQ